MGKLTDRHKKIRAQATEKICDLYHEAVLADKDWQKNKPEFAKKVDATLDEHIFRKLFT